MKKVILVSTFSFLIINAVFAQDNQLKNKNIYNSAKYLFIIYFPNGKMIQTENLISRHDEIVEMISRTETIKRYGVITKAGAVVSKTSANFHVVFINQILNMFHISVEDQQLPVYIDDQCVERPETIVAEPSEITSVEVMDGHTVVGRYINIKTKDYEISKQNDANSMTYSKYYLHNNETIAIDSFLFDAPVISGPEKK